LTKCFFQRINLLKAGNLWEWLFQGGKEMSFLWEITFCTTGDSSELDNLENALPSLFRQIVYKDREGGTLLALVEENYDGGPAIDAMIGRYPDLIFNGTMVYEREAQDGGLHFAFTGVGGNAEWRIDASRR
jgi:hypothetical protein